MTSSPIYQNINNITQKSSKNNLCYIVTPSTPSEILTNNSTTFVTSSIINNYEQKYMSGINVSNNRSAIPVEHSPYMKHTSLIDISGSTNNNTIVNTNFKDNINQKGSVHSFSPNIIQHSSNISILENTLPVVQIPRQQSLTYIQKNNGLLSPTNSHSSINSNSITIQNQRINDSNIIFLENSNPSYIIDTQTYLNQNTISQNAVTRPSILLTQSQSQSGIVERPYFSDCTQQSSSNTYNNKQIQTNYVQNIQNISPVQNQVQQQQVLTSSQSDNQQSFQLDNSQISTSSFATYVQPTIINSCYNKSNIQLNSNVSVQQEQINNNIIYNTDNFNNYFYSVTPINSTITIPIDSNNQNSNSNSVINQQTTIFNNNSNPSNINNYRFNLVASIPESLSVNSNSENSVNIDNYGVYNNGMIINQNNKSQDLEYNKIGNFYSTIPCKKNSSKDEVRQQKGRFKGDIYTPKLVRYSGNAKEGFCDQCNPGRWLQLKNSAYWYHKQFFHGISSVSGKLFHPPVATKILDYSEMLEVIRKLERKNMKENLLDNKYNKIDTKISGSSTQSDKNEPSIIASTEEFMKAFKNLIAESTINLPNELDLNDSILKFVVGLCHHCKEWIPLMITKKKSSQLFTNILKFKQNDNILNEKNKKNGKPINKYYLKKKYNMYNDKKNITEIIISYLQQVKQNKKEINDIIKNNGMTILWYRHAHKCHQYLRPKLNIENHANKNENCTNTTFNSKTITTSDSNNSTKFKEITETKNENASIETINITTTIASALNESMVNTNTNTNTNITSFKINVNSTNENIFRNSIHPITTSSTLIYSDIANENKNTFFPSSSSITSLIVSNTNTDNSLINNEGYSSSNNNHVVIQKPSLINNIQSQTLTYINSNCSNYAVSKNIINDNNKRIDSIYDYRQIKKEKLN
ncbi:hypothetical protein LY90DRAFT_678316 [Neocallimastix californiae]|uniref:Transcription regulator Rua1 C-terminal domain-containing protein n=1 Tax=Neocallimastix californiae TaxID=1754190 RepID=A0A1Y1Z9X4_9FUNG|nr:hypothetical protein LY90DRAFT_678316 [Neocallimastix californiae]|eukprot:ORY06924.1 hypothetical protein LY90DRAFT_678316 [Neocallimastix californiae]